MGNVLGRGLETIGKAHVSILIDKGHTGGMVDDVIRFRGTLDNFPEHPIVIPDRRKFLF